MGIERVGQGRMSKPNSCRDSGFYRKQKEWGYGDVTGGRIMLKVAKMLENVGLDVKAGGMKGEDL